MTLSGIGSFRQPAETALFDPAQARQDNSDIAQARRVGESTAEQGAVGQLRSNAPTPFVPPVEQTGGGESALQENDRSYGRSSVGSSLNVMA